MLREQIRAATSQTPRVALTAGSSADLDGAVGDDHLGHPGRATSTGTCGQLCCVETGPYWDTFSCWCLFLRSWPDGEAGRQLGRAVRCHLATDRFTPRQGSMR